MNVHSQEEQDAWFARGRAVDCLSRRGLVLRGSISVSNETTLRSALADANEPEWEQIIGCIRAEEIRREADRAWQDEFDSARARRESGPSEEEQAEIGLLRIEAERDYQDSMKPATRSQMNELISLQRDLLDAIRKR